MEGERERERERENNNDVDERRTTALTPIVRRAKRCVLRVACACVCMCVCVCVCDWTEALPWALWEGIASWPAAEEAEREGERTRQARGALFDAPSLLGRERPLKKYQRLRGRERTRETAIEREEKKREGERGQTVGAITTKGGEPPAGQLTRQAAALSC